MSKDARTPEEDQLDTDLGRLLAAAERKAEQGFGLSMWDAPHGFQSAQEQTICEELAKSLRQQAMADVREIAANADPNGFPDCDARSNGANIGVEVTELIDPSTRFSEWPLDRFEKYLRKRISDKDQKAAKAEEAGLLAAFDELWLVIATDESLLIPSVLRAYLNRLRLPKPSHFGAVFVLAPYEPGSNAVARGSEYEPQEELAGHTSFEVQWMR